MVENASEGRGTISQHLNDQSSAPPTELLWHNILPTHHALYRTLDLAIGRALGR